MGTTDYGEVLNLLALINRITVILSGAVGTSELAQAIAAALTSPLGLRFSRAFLLTYEERRECFLPLLAVGIADEQEAGRMVERLEAERAYLENLLVRNQDILPALVDHLKAASLWLEAIQRSDITPLQIEGWSNLRILPQADEPEGLFARLVAEPTVLCLDSPSDVRRLPPPLASVITAPFVALSVHTNKGARLAILADRAYQPAPDLSRAEAGLLEWFDAQAGLAWAAAELYGDLQRALEEERELDALKSSFLATISHELRTPLTAIIGFLGLLLGGQAGHLPDAQRNLLTRSADQAGHLLGLVNDLLQMAEYQSEGAQHLVVGRVDAAAAARKAVERLAGTGRTERAEIVLPPEGPEPVLVLANEEALERVFYHLLDNALKFGPPDGKVTVQFEPVGRYWYLSIVDRGIGIERSQLRRIFSHFYQVDSRLTRSFPGMGIGLTIVKMLLEVTRGHVLVESEPGVGSRFTVVYPSWKSDQPRVATENSL